MITAFGALFTAAGWLGLLVTALRRAPEGYEDEYGFHLITDVAEEAEALSRRAEPQHATAI